MNVNDPSLNPGLDYDSLKQDVERHYYLSLGQNENNISLDYLYRALALAIRDRLVARAKQTRSARNHTRSAFYLSMEFLMGRALGNAVHALDLGKPVAQFLLQYTTDLETVAASEIDAGLGNGGLGRLAACFLDSCAALELPVTGYGIRYEYGMFHQRIENGKQVEYADNWLRDGNPWELERAEDTRRIKFGGHTDTVDGKIYWLDTNDVLAVPYDILIPGYRNEVVNVLRLWKAEATDEFDLAIFNAGSYPEAVEAKNDAENITKVLYPNDVSENGKALRLRQQYFLASASLQDVVSTWLDDGQVMIEFGDNHIFQLNDTHPSCAIPELMRILLDDHKLAWDDAWKVTTSSMAYTNHTLLPEALERWSVQLFRELLPRILEIIYEINARFLQQVSHRWPGDAERLQRMSIIEEGPVQMVRMSYLAIVGSFSINGVAALHSSLLCETLFRDFHDLWPSRFNNKTNGVTPRRWIQHANPDMSALIDEAIGESWKTDLTSLKELVAVADDFEFQQRWQGVKLDNKKRLVDHVTTRTGIILKPEWLLDVQVKRIHEYKRQLLNILHVIHLYDRHLRGDGESLQPRTVLIGGKAAPGYVQAKLTIHFINCVAQVINQNPLTSHKLRLAFIPDYGVSAMELICPATELSEQISTAGKEASGTGNMKFMMNGALTIGTLDGANIEIREQVGEENFFCFGLDAPAVQQMAGCYDPNRVIDTDEDLRRVMKLIEEDHFSMFTPGCFKGIASSIRNPSDPWLLAADFRDYINTQARVEAVYSEPHNWHHMSILNTARSGWFSSDRTIAEYARDIWRIPGDSNQV